MLVAPSKNKTLFWPISKLEFIVTWSPDKGVKLFAFTSPKICKLSLITNSVESVDEIWLPETWTVPNVWVPPVPTTVPKVPVPPDTSLVVVIFSLSKFIIPLESVI